MKKHFEIKLNGLAVGLLGLATAISLLLLVISYGKYSASQETITGLKTNIESAKAFSNRADTYLNALNAPDGQYQKDIDSHVKDFVNVLATTSTTNDANLIKQRKTELDKLFIDSYGQRHADIYNLLAPTDYKYYLMANRDETETIRIVSNTPGDIHVLTVLTYSTTEHLFTSVNQYTAGN